MRTITVIRLAVVLLLGLATFWIGDSSLHSHGVLAILAGLIVGLAAAAQLSIAVGERLSLYRKHTYTEIRGVLHLKLVEWTRNQRFAPELDMTRVSFHVWEVPAYYRRLFPFKLRRYLQRTAWKRSFLVKLKQLLQHEPRLKNAARVRFDAQSESDVPFRKGEGLVGLALERNNLANVIAIDFESNRSKRALRSEAAWEAEDESVTCNLSYENAQILAARYGRAVAIVLQARSGDAIGCLTLEIPTRVPPNARPDFRRDQRLLAELGSLAGAVSLALRY